MTNKKYLNWQVERDQDDILWLYLDKQDASTNTLGAAILDELEMILDDLEAGPMPKGMIIASAKPSGFIAGADVEKFPTLKTPAQAKEFIVRGQMLFNRVADLPCSTVAMIKGFCLGGGLELALACRYRIAENGPKTRLGLPEVMLGIHPGWGGCERLPALIGAIEAMKLILNGNTIDAKKAQRLGLVDEAVPLRHLERAARSYILTKPEPHRPSTLQAMTNTPLVRPLIAKLLRRQLNKKIKIDHYPAPYAVVENWLQYGTDRQKGLAAEAESLSNLVLNDTARNLLRVFFLRERLKSLGKTNKFAIAHVHVIGAGTMGGDIAAWCAAQGLNVTLQDREAKYIAPAIKRAHALFTKRFKEPRLISAAMDRLVPDIHGDGIKTADIIIEAIFENLEAKQDLLKVIEANAKPDAIIATNTSSIPLDEMNTLMKKPERLVGIHFFNPVAKMQLVEVVQGKHTSEQVVKNALSFVHRIDRLPLPVTSSPGFLVNRVLMPYLMESMLLLQEGVPAPVIDDAALNFGMPMGPIELADTVGLDVCLSVAENLSKYYGGTVPTRLREMVAAGQLGRKTGNGFYRYKNGKPQKHTPKNYIPGADIADRLILRMINEAMACLRERVVADEDLLDAGMIFGTGFAPFRGGPMQYLQAEGVKNLKQRLQNFTQIYGARFKLDPQWESDSTPEAKIASESLTS